MRKTPTEYTLKTSQQTLREGIAEYYQRNPHVTDPATQSDDFAKVLASHDALHVIYGLTTDMYDELKLLVLSWWTSECTFGEYLKMKNTPAVDVMYDDMIKEKGTLWLYTRILRTLPKLLVELPLLRLQTKDWPKRLPFFDYEILLDKTLLEIRQDYNLLQFM